MSLVLRRKRKTQFQRAAEGSMSLLEHLRELRTRLFKAALGVAAGFIVGYLLSGWAKTQLKRPYCDLLQAQEIKRLKGAPLPPDYTCSLQMLAPTDGLVLTMQIALYLGLIIAAPIWLYQLWAFIAPGLHRHERRWAYVFVAIAAPLFAVGALLAYLVVGRGLEFLFSFNSGAQTNLDITKYFAFITGLMLMFGVAFEFPLVVMLFNIAGIATAKRLLRWWRIAVLAFFLFAGAALPTGDPFSMIALGLGLTALYFGAVLFAYFNDRRRERSRRAQFGDVGDDEVSPISYEGVDPVEAGTRIEAPSPIEPVRPVSRRYDDMT